MMTAADSTGPISVPAPPTYPICPDMYSACRAGNGNFLDEARYTSSFDCLDIPSKRQKEDIS